MKERGRRSSAFIVSRCLEPMMKHEARIFDMASQKGLFILNSSCFANCDVNLVVSSGKWVIKDAVRWFNLFCFDA